MVAALFDDDRALRLSDYLRFLAELRERNPGGFNLRTVEKAYYHQCRNTCDVGRW